MIQNIMLVVYQGSIENDLFRQIKGPKKRKKLTQKELAEQIGIKQNSYSDWENGKTEPSFENLIKLADLLEVSLDWLFGREQMKVKKRSPAFLQMNI